MAPEAKRRALQGMLNGHAPFSYKPLKRSLGDVLGLRHRLLEVDQPPLAVTLEQISRASKSEQERAANLQLAQLLHDGLRADGLQVIEEQFQRLHVAPGVSLGFCADAVLSKGAEVIVGGFNFRRTPFAGASLRFALSVVHEQSRAVNADLASARLALVQFPHPKGGERYMSLLPTDGADLYSYEELARMAAETHAVWVELLEAAADEAKRTGTDDQERWWR